MAKSLKTPKKGTSVVVRGPDQLPAFMEGHAGEGTEKLGRGDFEIPRIQLLQAISPEVEAFDAAEPGHFWHNMAEISLGEKLTIVPVFVDVRYILWRPRSEGGGILARADDGVHWNPPDAEFTVKLKSGKQVSWRTAQTVVLSGLDRWGSSDPEDTSSQPAATLMYSIVCELPAYPELGPAVVTLQRSGVRVARKLLGKINLSRAPSYGMQFVMSSITEQGLEGPFKNYRFISDGFVDDKDRYEKYQQTYQLFREAGFSIRDLETAQEGDAEQTGENPNDKIPY